MYRKLKILLLISIFSGLESMTLAGEHRILSSPAGVEITFPSVKEETLEFASPDASSGTRAYSFPEYVESQQFFIPGKDTILKASEPGTETAAYPHLNSGLLSTIAMAYNKHLPLKLRPDDIWLTITGVAGRYINDHSEEFRSRFVDHEGKKKLEIRVMSPFIEYTTESHWNAFLSQMADKIDENIKDKELRNWFVPDFSTTTQRDRIVGGIQLMSSTQAYFSMHMMMCCGLPRVILQGTLADWEKIRQRVSYLKSFGGNLAAWGEVLEPILDQFVASYRGTVSDTFWETICSSKRKGSGSDIGYTGWFLAFAPFDERGNYLLATPEKISATRNYAHSNSGVLDNTIEHGMVEVPVTINDHGQEYNTVFYGGVSMPKYNNNTHELSPSVDWAIIQKKKLTLEDMLDIYNTRRDHSYYHQDASRKVLTDMDSEAIPLMKFAHHVANQLLISNARLAEMAQIVSTVYLEKIHYQLKEARERGAPLTFKDTCKLLYQDLRDEHTYSRWDFESPSYFEIKKAVVLDRMDELVNSFEP